MRIINRFLLLDPRSQERLQALAGRVVAITLKPFHLTFQCHFSTEGMTLQRDHFEPAEVHITGTPLQLISLTLQKDKRHTLFADDLTLEGDATLGHEVIALFDELQIDWEEHLSQLIGDTPAYHVGRFTKRLRNWFSQTDNSLTRHVDDYLHEEARWYPAREALQDFFNDIDQTRMDLDRLTARIKQLTERLP